MRRILLLVAFALSACQSGDPSAYAPAPAPVYETLHHPKFKGAFFQFEHDGDRYLACSIHQAHLKPGDQLRREGDPKPVTVGNRLKKQNDLHVWSFEHPAPQPEHFLKYQPDVQLEVEDRIFFLHRGRKIAATVVALPSGDQFRHTYRTDEPFAAAGLSGSPVYLPRTGSVIGVLQTANDKKKATLGGFEILDLD
jgi:hypothetical protein